MNNKLINAAMFVVGAAIGSLVTWKVIAVRYEQKVQEEVDSVKATYAQRPIAKVVEIITEDGVKIQSADEYHDNIERKKKVEEIVKAQGYTDYSNFSKPDQDEQDEKEEPDEEEPDEEKPVFAERDGDNDEPYVISPEEFGELDSYNRISLTYYSDGILADEFDELVDDYGLVVGPDFSEHFGEYEDDSVFIRNDKLKSDYEILKDLRRWEDVVNPPKPKTRKAATKKPHQMEDE